MQCATCSGVRSSRTPAASSTSALPERLDTERLPCFATRAPAAAATNAAVVEMLKVPLESPPVPQVSTRCSPATGTAVASSRITIAAAAISSTLSPFIRRPMRKPPICAAVADPLMIWRITACISALLRSRRANTAPIAACISIVVTYPMVEKVGIKPDWRSPVQVSDPSTAESFAVTDAPAR